MECAAPGDVGEVWIIPYFNHSGLFSSVFINPPQNSQVAHYVRQETKDLWNKLEECRTSNFEHFSVLRVYGDSGSGKSSTVWGYTQFVGCQSSVVWVTQSKKGYRLAWSAREDTPYHMLFKFTEFKEMADALLRHEPTLVVLDGIVLGAEMAICSLSWLLSHFVDNMK